MRLEKKIVFQDEVSTSTSPLKQLLRLSVWRLREDSCFFFFTKINVTGRDRAHSSGDHFYTVLPASSPSQGRQMMNCKEHLLFCHWRGGGGGGLVLKVSLNGLFSNLTGVVWYVCFSAVSQAPCRRFSSPACFVLYELLSVSGEDCQRSG